MEFYVATVDVYEAVKVGGTCQCANQASLVAPTLSVHSADLVAVFATSDRNDPSATGFRGLVRASSASHSDSERSHRLE